MLFCSKPLILQILDGRININAGFIIKWQLYLLKKIKTQLAIFFSQTLRSFMKCLCEPRCVFQSYVGVMFDCTNKVTMILKRDCWHPKSSAVSKQFTSLSLPSLCLSPSAAWPPLLGGRVTTSGSSRPCACLCILAFLPHVPAFAAIPSRNCISSQGWGFPGLIKTKRVFQFRVIERVQHINMLGQRYQPVSLQGGDRWWSWHTRTNILSGCGFCLIGSFAAQIPTYLMLMMKSQEGCEILVN